MKWFVTVFLLTSVSISFSQLFDTIGLPGNYFTLHYRDLTTPLADSTKYTVISYRVDNLYRKTTILLCADSSWLSNTYKTPEICEYWEVYDSLAHLSYSNPNIKYYTYNDSLKFTNDECLNDFYKSENDSVKLNTIYVCSDNNHWMRDGRVWRCDYDLINGVYIKNGYEAKYYYIDELPSSSCIELNQLLEYEGWWKLGKKQGIWNYYSPTGKLIRIERYRKGKLISTKIVE